MSKRPVNTFSVGLGRYDFLHPNDKQVYIHLHWRKDAPGEVQRVRGKSTWAEDHSDRPENPTTMVEAVKHIRDYEAACIYTSTQEETAAWAEKALEYLQSVEREDAMNALWNERDDLEARLDAIRAELHEWEYADA